MRYLGLIEGDAGFCNSHYFAIWCREHAPNDVFLSYQSHETTPYDPSSCRHPSREQSNSYYRRRRVLTYLCKAFYTQMPFFLIGVRSHLRVNQIESFTRWLKICTIPFLSGTTLVEKVKLPMVRCVTTRTFISTNTSNEKLEGSDACCFVCGYDFIIFMVVEYLF